MEQAVLAIGFFIAGVIIITVVKLLDRFDKDRLDKIRGGCE